MKVALVHDHLTQNGGAERVLEALQAIWPEAPTYTLLYDEKKMKSTFGHRNIRTSVLQNLPFAISKSRWYLPFMPTATEGYDLSEFDVVISSSSAFAKGIIPPPHGIHISYCHTPTRYLWSDTHEYSKSNIPKLLQPFSALLLTELRMWDKLSADRVDFFVANSDTTKRRISRYYQHESDVIYPPVDTEYFSISEKPKNYFLIGGRLVAYKRYDLVIDAFTQLGLPLKVFGDGPMEKVLRASAGKNVEFLGRVSNEERARLFSEAIAFMHPQEEDFGITPVESMAAGRPVIAYNRGGAVESVIEGKTGTLFNKQTWQEVADVVMNFDHTKYDPKIIKKHAEEFSTSIFRKNIYNFVTEKWEEHKRKILGQL